MNRHVNIILTGAIFGFISFSSCAEVHQCQVDDKVVFQQTPCPVEVVEDSCDANHDYSEDAYEVATTFDHTYCYYLQLNNLSSQEKQRLMKIYKQKRAEAQLLVKQKEVYKKLTDSDQATNSEVKNSSEGNEILNSTTE